MESRNGTTSTVPVMSMPLADDILSRWALVPNRTASVLAGLRSSPFSRNQRATSSTHSETAVKVTSALHGSNGHVQLRVVSVLMVVQTV